MVSINDVAHVLPALIRCALADVRAGDSEQRSEAKMFLDRVWPTWRTSSIRRPTEARQ